MAHAFQRIAIVGAGNVAWHLAPTLQKAGCAIVQVVSKSKENAEAFAHQIGAQAIARLQDLEPELDLVLVAVKDDALTDVASGIPQNLTVAHTSGSVPLDIFPHENRGVFYPLQTFSKDRKLDWENIPICIEASNKTVEESLLALAQKMSRQVHLLDSEKRAKLHIAAVFACNFTNHLLGLSSDLLREESLDTHLLDALITETVQKALKHGAHEMQTGPAVRKDTNVMAQHLEQLTAYPHLENIYTILSNSIIQTKNGEEL